MKLSDLFSGKRKLFTTCLLLFLMLGIPAPTWAAGASLDQWQLRNPLPTGANLLAATYGGNLFVAVGDGGAIVTSPDGVTWTRRDSGTPSNLTGVTYGDGAFVAVGSSGTIIQAGTVRASTVPPAQAKAPIPGRAAIIPGVALAVVVLLTGYAYRRVNSKK